MQSHAVEAWGRGKRSCRTILSQIIRHLISSLSRCNQVSRSSSDVVGAFLGCYLLPIHSLYHDCSIYSIIKRLSSETCTRSKTARAVSDIGLCLASYCKEHPSLWIERNPTNRPHICTPLTRQRRQSGQVQRHKRPLQHRPYVLPPFNSIHYLT